MNTVNKFDIELIKGFARPTNANRTRAVQMICSGVDKIQCKDNAQSAYQFCVVGGAVGMDRGTLEIFRQLANLPLHIWDYFKGADAENAEGEKIANKLIRLAQANALCAQYKCSYDDGYKQGYNVAHKEAEEKDSAEDSAAGIDNGTPEDSAEDSADGIDTSKS